MGRCGSVVRMGGLSACMDGSVPSSLFAASILGSGMLLINHGDIASGGQLPNWWVIALTYGLIYLTFTIGLIYARLRCPTCRNRIVVAVEENPNPEQDVSVMDYLANKDRTATPTEETPRRFQPQPRLLLHYREDEGERDREQDKNGNGNGGSNRVKSIYALAHEDVILDPPKNDIEMGFGGGHPRVAPGVDPRFSGSSETSSWQVEDSLRQDRAGDSTQQQEFHESAHSLSNLKNERAHVDEIRPCSSTTRVHWEDLGGPSVVQSPSLEERASRLHERGRGRETGRGKDRERARGRTSSRARHRHRSRSRRDVKPEASDRNEHHMEGETSERSGRGPERGRSRIRGSSTSARQTVSPGRTVEVTHDVMVYKNSLFMEDMAVIDTYRARDKSPAKEPDVRSSSTVVSSTSFRKWLG